MDADHKAGIEKSGFGAVAGFRPDRQDWLAAFLMLLSLLVFFAPVILGGVFFFRDICTEIVPKRGFLSQSGLQVLWNPYLFFGLPTAANMQSSAFYPLNFTFYLGSTPVALSYYIILHFAIALAGTYVLVRSLRGSAPAALAGALAFTYGGFFVSCGNQAVVLSSAAWIMPLLWAAARALTTGRRGFIVGAGMFWAMQVLGGEPEIAYLSGVILIIFLAGLVLGGRIELSARDAIRRCVFIAAASMALALCLSCVQWLITLELSGISNRAGGLSFNEALKWSLEPKALSTLLAPNYIMDPTKTDWWVLGFQTSQLPYLLSVYPGVAVLILILSSLRGLWRSSIVFLGGALFFLILSLGRYGGIYWVFYHLLPGFDRFRIPERCIYGFAVFLALLVAMALDHVKDNWEIISKRLWFHKDRNGRIYMLPIVVPIFTVFLGIGLFLLVRNPSMPLNPDDYLAYHSQLQSVSIARSMIWLGLALLLLVMLRSKLMNLITWAFCALIFLDLFVAHLHVTPTVGPDFYSLSGHLASGLPGGGRDLRVAVAQPGSMADRTIGAGRDVVEFYRNQRLGLQPFAGLEPLVRDAGAKSSFYPADVDLWLDLMPSFGERLLALGGVRYALRPGKEPLAVEKPLPRAFVIPEARWLPDRQSALEAMKDPAFDPREAVLLEGAASAMKPPRLDNIFWPMEIVRDDRQRVEVLVEPYHPGWLVLLDTFYPGWTARFNGEKVPIYRANGFFRAVAVGSEGGRVEFAYWPRRFYAGLLVSLGALAVCLAVLFKGRAGILWWGAWIIVLVALPMEDGGTTYLPVTALRIMALLMAAAWAWRQGAEKSTTFYRTRIDIWVLAFWLLAAFSMLRSSYFYISLYWCLNIFTYVLIFYLAIQFTAGDGQRAEKRVNGIFGALVAGYTIQALWAVFEMAAGHEKASAGYFNPNYLAGALMAISPYLLSRGLMALRQPEGEGRVEAAGWGVLFAVFTLGILATQSRAAVIWPVPLAMVALPGMQGILASRGFTGERARRMSAGALVGIFILALAAVAVFPNPLRERILGARHDPYAFERVGIWKAGLKMTADHPLGVGQGMFKYYFYQYKFPVEGVPAGRFEKRANNAHNEYINAAAEMSPLAPLLLVLSAGILLLGAWQRGRGSFRESEMMGAAAGIAAIALHAIFDSNLHNHSIAVLSVVFAAVLLTELSRSGEGWLIIVGQGRGAKWIIRLLLTALLVGGSAGYAFLGWSFGKSLKAAQHKDPKRALFELEESARYSAGNALPFKNLAGVLFAYYLQTQDINYLSRAVKAADAAIKLNPTDPAPHGRRAECMLEFFKLLRKPELVKEAYASFMRAGTISPYDVDYWIGLARAERAMGKKEAEIDWLKGAVELEPYDLAARLGLVRALLEAGRSEEAGRQLEKFIALRGEVRKILRKNPDAFATPYRSKRIKVDESELAAVEELLNKARKDTRNRESGRD
jgi:tetratricopeptide (TPR) repeat protein